MYDLRGNEMKRIRNQRRREPQTRSESLKSTPAQRKCPQKAEDSPQKHLGVSDPDGSGEIRGFVLIQSAQQESCHGLMNRFIKPDLRLSLMLSITPSHRHREQRQGPGGRRQRGVRARGQVGVVGVVASAIGGRRPQVSTRLVGALPLLQSLGAHGQRARAHGQQHDERAQEERDHRPQDAVQQDAGVVGTPPQDVVRPETTTGSKQREKKSRVTVSLL